MSSTDLQPIYDGIRAADAAGDTASVQRLSAYLQQQGGSTPPPSAPPPQSVGGFVAREAARLPIKMVAAAPLMAMDAGVFGRNVLGNAYNSLAGNPATPDYQLPSQMFNQQLDSTIRPPDGTAAQIMENLDAGLLGGKLPTPTVSGAPANFVNPATSLRNAVVQNAQRQGYVIPPAAANPTLLNKVLTRVGGKQNLTEGAQQINQGVTNRTAATALGQRPDAVLTPQALAVIRTEAYNNGYAPIDRFGQITTDATFRAQIANLLKNTQKAEQAFPGLTNNSGSSQVVNTVGSLERPLAMNSDGARAAVQHLRDQADAAFASGNSADGNTYKAAAKAVEDLIERNLQNAKAPGAQDALANFRAARQRIATTYTVQKALTGTDVDATKIATQLANKPYGGPLKTTADFAATFKNAGVRVPTGVPAGSGLDAYAGLMGAIAEHHVWPLAIPFGRAATARFLLSPQGQAMALQRAYSAPQQLGGLLGMTGQGSTAGQ